MRVNRFVLPLAVIAALLGTTLAAQAAGWWSTSGRSEVAPGNLTPADLKGWMTLQQVIDGLGIAPDELYPLAGIPEEVPPDTALKDLEALVPGFEISTLRDKLTAWAAAGTVEPTVPTPAPISTRMPTSEAVATVPQPTLAPPAAGHADGTGTGPTPLPAGSILPADQIKGKLTLRQVSEQCGVPLDALLAELELPATADPDTAIKDLISQGSLTDVDQVQASVAKLQQP